MLIKGFGKVITSGKACHGKETKFLKEFTVGDYIGLIRSGTFKQEYRKVNGVLSDKSLCLASPFKPNIPTFSNFKIRMKGNFLYILISLNFINLK